MSNIGDRTVLELTVTVRLRISRSSLQITKVCHFLNANQLSRRIDVSCSTRKVAVTKQTRFAFQMPYCNA